MLPELFEQARPVLRKLEEAGYQAFFVGGAVRDLLLNRSTNDIDIATSALPEEVKSVFPKTIDVGIEHGTVVVINKSVPYEITTFRSESGYRDHRRPESVTFITSLREDLKRRDFTMNAIAMDSSGRIHDPFQGEEDLKACMIRTVGAADERFKEDALRMMRAVRFMAQLNFKVNIETFESIKQNGKTLNYIAVERVTAEFEKLLSGKYKEASFKTMERTGLHRYLPGLNSGEEAFRSLGMLSYNHLTNVQMWLLLVYLSKDGTSFLENWRLPSKKAKYITRAHSFLLSRITKEWDQYALYQAGYQTAVDVETVYAVLNHCKAKADELKKSFDKLPIKDRGQLQLTGNDLMEWTGKTGGAWIKEELKKAEMAVIKGKIPNEKNAIREWLGLCNHQ
ncbi:CCA tRNA nucleotidyltransferase [Bacillus sp. AK031]